MLRTSPPLVPTEDGALRSDCRGLLCPLPIVEAGKALRTLAVGDVLEILSDDPAVDLDLRDWAAANRQELLFIRQDGDVFCARVRKLR